MSHHCHWVSKRMNIPNSQSNGPFSTVGREMGFKSSGDLLASIWLNFMVI